MITRSRLIFCLKLAVGLALMAFLLLWNDNWRQVGLLFRDIRWVYLAPFFGVSLLTIGISCLKWRLFIREQGVQIGLPRLFGYYLIGFFFNNFLPSNFGGDVVRAYVLGRRIESQARSAATVFLERLTGLVALVILALAAFLFTPTLRGDLLIATSIAVMGGGCALLLLAILRPRLIVWLTRPLQGLGPVAKALPKIQKLHAHILFFKDRRVLVVKAMAYSFLFHFATAVNVYVTALLIGAEVSLMQLVVITPIILLIASLPLTPNSLGVWETAFSVYLVSASVGPAQGLTIALLLRAKNLLISLMGGLLFLVEGRPAVVPAATATTPVPPASPGMPGTPGAPGIPGTMVSADPNLSDPSASRSA